MRAPALALALSFALACPAFADAPRKLVVLDPGHGGTNVGGQNLTLNLREKDLTLDICKRIQARLATFGIETRLTRDSDQSLTLRQRMMVANQSNADFLVSVHTNASPTKTQRGYETYVLTAKAVDVDGRALRRNAGAMRQSRPEVARLLDDLERGAAQWDAAELAADVQLELAAVRGTAHNRGVRQDAQHVLLGATMPAVLVEVGFLDHAIEGRELALEATREQLADAISRALVTQYQAAARREAGGKR